MQDSSLNPYIPQESEAIRHQTETLHSPLGRAVKILLIITGVLSVLIGIGLFFLAPMTSTEDKQARVELGNVVQPPDQLAKLVPVKSTLGFSLQYDNQLFESYAETVAPANPDGKTQASSPYFENDDLRTSRNYNLVRLRPNVSPNADSSAITNPPELLVTSAITPKMLKEAAAKPDYKGLSQLSLFVKLSSEIRLAARTADDGTTVTIDASQPVSQTINSVQYQKVRYKTTNDNYRISNQKYDDCYYTIQHKLPYAACVTNIRPSNVDAAAMDEQMLKSLAFAEPQIKDDATTDAKDADKTDSKETSKDAAKDTTKDATTEEETIDQSEADDSEVEAPLIAKKPEYNENALSLKTIAKNQPSTVRIGTLYCADLALKLESGDTAMTLTDACAGGVSSGTIVSKDGYIATTGHAIRYTPKDAITGYINFAKDQKDMLDRLDRVLEYMIKAKLNILQSDVDYLKIGAQTGDQEALAKIENLGSIIPDNFVTPVKDNYSYAIQPSDKPIVVDSSTGTKPTFAYSDSVLSGKFIVADYDAEKSVQEVFGSDTPTSDIGLLKVDGSFQNVTVGVGDDIKADNILNTVGYPAYTDNSLTIDKIRNTPVATDSKVGQTYDKDGHRLIQTDTPIVPGNDGAGTFDQTGNLVGLGVYGLSYCPDQQCFANGTIRSSNELLSLVEKQNLKLGDISEATVTWRKAVDDYFRGDYASARSEFKTAGASYAFNQLASPLQKLAQSKLGSKSDTSLANQAMSILIGVLIAMVILTILLAILFLLQRRRLDMMRVGHYGAGTPVAQPAAVLPSTQPFMPPQGPQQQQWAPQQQSVPQQPYQTPPPAQQAGPYQAPQQQPQQPFVNPQQTPVQPQIPPEDPFYKQ
jgi:S1-C subfamily serine protease